MSGIMLVPAPRISVDDIAAEVQRRYDEGGGPEVLAYVADLTVWGNTAAAEEAFATYDQIIGGER